MAVSVPYDVVLEILLRVKDVVTLFRCAATCKGWYCLLAADPFFVRRCLTEDVCRSAPFAGFFTERRLRRGIPAPCIVPGRRPFLDPCCRSLNFFLPNIHDRSFFDHAVPLASRHGLLLVRLDMYRAGIDPNPRADHLGVCNLLAGTFHLLPRLDHKDMVGYAILTDKDYSNNKDQPGILGSFKVLAIRIGGRVSGDVNMMKYRLRTFSSAGEPRWNTCDGSVKAINGICMQLWQHSAIVCRGIAHWVYFGLTGIYTFGVCVDTNHFSFTSLPAELHNLMFPDYEPHISVDTEDRLTLFFMQRRGPQLEIWTLHDNGRWTRARMLTLKQLKQKKETQSVSYTCLGQKSGTLLIKDSHHHAYYADSMTGVMQKVKNWTDKCNLSRKKTVPMDMDWPTFFLSRLSVAL